ncbi:hypothetical protein GXB85_11870 [Cellulomonas sp. APG4]|uniref:hypothetical protein n=1 Tax=Cellulomonas sp. APG4 TaxID=1538656 RepID=UPI00137B420E|nr:hypothetical protein [Cellulomonas sp. APG4]NCT91642.1 hypothetical protein [Cellulomonas sp. APG4]
MAQITVHHHLDHEPADAPRGDEERPHDTLRSVVPVTVAFALLLGVVVVAGIALKDVLDFGVWLLSAG